MISRYTNEEMGSIWTDENKFATWLKVEIAIMQALAAEGIIPEDAVEAVRSRAKIDVQRILEIERTVKHDVVAFTTSIAEFVGEPARYFHFGVTSSDVLDTALVLQVQEAGEILLEDIKGMLKVLKRRALELKETVLVGRTHGIHAEPTTMGLKFALWYEALQRSKKRLKAALHGIRFGKVSGSVGTFAHLPPTVEERTCEILGLQPAPVSTQILQRDRHAALLAVLAVMAGTVESIAVEIRALQRTDIREVEEEFTAGQKGSSSMPHKRNPIGSENISGLSRLIRTNALAAMENQALWHERDISHSSVERVIFPDSFILSDYIIRRLTKILDRLVIYPERMLENLWLTNGLIFSQRVLLALVQKGLSREEAYEISQRNAMQCWNDKTPLKQLLATDQEASKLLSERELDDLFSPESMLNNVDSIFERVFG